MTSKSLGPSLALALLALTATACPAEPDPGTTTDDASSSSTTSTSFPDECGTGGGVNDYCCQFNSNYCDTDTETDTSPSDTDSTVPETDTDPLPPDTDTDTDGTLAGCECIPEEAGGEDPGVPSMPTCGELLCGDVPGSCSGWCDESPLELSSPEALECALVALRDRTPGILRWSLEWNGGQYDEDGYVLINADGTAVRRRWGRSDFVFEAEGARLGELPPAEHFDACLANPDDLARFDCMRAELDSMLGVCDGGWSYDVE